MPSVTLTYSTADAQRILVALGKQIHPDKSPATAAEAKTWITQNFITLVKNQDRQDALDALVPNDPVIT